VIRRGEFIVTHWEHQNSIKKLAAMSIRDLLAKALAHHQAGRLHEAKIIYDQSLNLDPLHPDALHLRGVIAMQTGDPDMAVRLIERAIQIHSTNAGYHANLAQARLAQRRVDAALDAFRTAARLDPRNPQYAAGTASCLAQQGHLVEAEAQLRKVAQDHPDYALAWLNLGNAVLEQRRPHEALEFCLRAAKLEPQSADAHVGVGRALHALGRFEEAEGAYRRCLALQPDADTGYRSLAAFLIDSGKFADAVTTCEQGLLRDPRSVELQMMLGSAFVHQGRMTAALRAFRSAAELAPNDSRALWALGIALRATGSLEEGMKQCKRVLELQPDSPEFRHAIAGAYLALGDLQAGWKEYEWRPARQTFIAENSHIRLAHELPASLQGRKVCLLREQGLGDELFFLRYASELKSRGAEITYLANAKLASLLGRVRALDQVLTGEIPLAKAELTMLAGDLPRLLGASNYPPPLSLTPLPQRLQELRQRMAALGPPPYIGLTWRAGVAPEDQRGTSWMLHKRIPLEDLGAALRGVEGTFVALQRRPHPGEIERLAGALGRPLHEFTALNEDLEAMLALLALLDDYISVSNTNVHLRAGTGHTARVLVPCPPEWRWMAAGDQSPWFPGFHVYRQGPDGDWNDALGRLTRELLDARRTRALQFPS
jgi:tetratricopeptide (TPR) repeat protein